MGRWGWGPGSAACQGLGSALGPGTWWGSIVATEVESRGKRQSPGVEAPHALGLSQGPSFHASIHPSLSSPLPGVRDAAIDPRPCFIHRQFIPGCSDANSFSPPHASPADAFRGTSRSLFASPLCPMASGGTRSPDSPGAQPSIQSHHKTQPHVTSDHVLPPRLAIQGPLYPPTWVPCCHQPLWATSWLGNASFSSYLCPVPSFQHG